MADEAHEAMFRRGVKEWNAWRRANPYVVPDLFGMTFEKANPRGVNLLEMRSQQPNLEGINLQGARLEGVSLEGVSLEGANLREARLERTHLRQAGLARAHLEMANLEGAILYRVNFNEAYLSGADLRGADLYRAYLYKANLQGVNLQGADLYKADLQGANLQGADLQGASLQRADLQGVNLQGADLQGVNLQEVSIGNTLFVDTNLSGVIGLETIRHRGPSEVSISTLYKSGGNIPKVFLRGCGVPDSLIEYLPSLIGAMQPIQFYSCFISYSTNDEAFAKRLHRRMQQEHLRVWFAPEELKGGLKLADQFNEAIRLHDKLLLVLSDASMASSWVAHEVRRANARQQREGK